MKYETTIMKSFCSYWLHAFMNICNALKAHIHTRTHSHTHTHTPPPPPPPSPPPPPPPPPPHHHHHTITSTTTTSSSSSSSSPSSTTTKTNRCASWFSPLRYETMYFDGYGDYVSSINGLNNDIKDKLAVWQPYNKRGEVITESEYWRFAGHHPLQCLLVDW